MLSKISKRLIDQVWIACLAIMDALAVLMAPRRIPGMDGVLVVRLDAIGDFVLWLDGARALRELYPPDKCRLTLVGNRVWTDLAEELGCFDEVWPVERKRFVRDVRYRLALLCKVRATGFRIALQPTYSREFQYGDAIVRASAAVERIGFEGDTSNIPQWLKPVSDRWYSKLISAPSRPMTELERNAEFMRGLGVSNFRATVPRLLADPTLLPPELRGVAYYVVFPGAGQPCKRWPPDRFREIARRIHARTGWIGVVCGGASDIEFGKAITAEGEREFFDTTGRTTIAELCAILAHARLIVTNDTGAAHLAAAFRSPTVCILGGGHYGRFLPYGTKMDRDGPLPIAVSHRMSCFGCGWNCVYEIKQNEAVPCVANVSIETVWEAVVGLLPGIGRPDVLQEPMHE